MIGAYEHAANQSRGPTGFQYSFLYWLTTLLLFFTSIPEKKNISDQAFVLYSVLDDKCRI